MVSNWPQILHVQMPLICLSTYVTVFSVGFSDIGSYLIPAIKVDFLNNLRYY